MGEINGNILFNKIIGSYQYRFLKEDNWKVNSISNMKEYDLYVNIDLSKFTSFDTISNAMFSIDVESVSSYTELFVYKTNNYNLEDIHDTTELSSSDVGSYGTYDDFVILQASENKQTITFDITNIMNNMIITNGSKLSFRIYHNKTSNINIDNLNISFNGIICRYHKNEYLKFDMGNCGNLNINYNSLNLKQDLFNLDLGYKIIPISFASRLMNKQYKSILGGYSLTNYEYAVTINNSNVIITNYNDDSEVFHMLSNADALTYHNYECLSGEILCTSGVKNRFIVVTFQANNIIEIKYYNNNMIYTIEVLSNYTFYNNCVYGILKSIKRKNDSESNPHDEYIFNWNTNYNLIDVKYNNNLIIAFSYNDLGFISSAFIYKTYNYVTFSYGLTNSLYYLNNFKIYKSSRDSSLGLTPYVDNDYIYGEHFGLILLKNVYDNINNKEYKITYHTNDSYISGISKVEECFGINNLYSLNIVNETLEILNQYGEKQTIYFDSFKNVNLVIDDKNRYRSMHYNTKYNGLLTNTKKSIYNKRSNKLSNGTFSSVGVNGKPNNWSVNSMLSDDKVFINSELSNIIGNSKFCFSLDTNPSCNIRSISQIYIPEANGKPFENWEFSLWYKGIFSRNNIFDVEIEIHYVLENEVKVYNFPIYYQSDYYQIFSGNFTTTGIYDYINFKINYQGKNSIYIADVKLYQYNKNNNYDINQNNKLESISSNNNQMEYQYDDNNKLIKTIDNNGFVYRYTYDYRGNISQIENPFTNDRINYLYDSSNNLIQERINYNNKINVKNYTYSSNNEITTEQLNNQNITEYEYLKGNLNKIIYNNNEKIYTYDNRNNIDLIELKNNNNTLEKSGFNYDSNNLVESIETSTNTSSNNIIYNYLYDSCNRIELIDVNYVTLFEAIYAKINNKESTLINEHKFYDGSFYFTYDSYNRLEYVKYNSSNYYKFEYDELDRITKIYDYINNINKEYLYDENNNVILLDEYVTINNINTINKYTYTYDNSSRIQKRTISCNHAKTSYEHDYIDENNTYNVKGFLSRVIKDTLNDYVLPGIIELVYGNNPLFQKVEIVYDEDLKCKKYVNKYLNSSIIYNIYDANAKRHDLKKYNNKEYSRTNYLNTLETNKCIYGYFKIPTNGETEILFMYSDTDAYTLSLNSNSKLELKIGINDGEVCPYCRTIVNTNISVDLDKWNFIGLEFTQEFIKIYYNNTNVTHPITSPLKVESINTIGIGRTILQYDSSSLSDNIEQSVKLETLFVSVGSNMLSNLYKQNYECNKYLNDLYEIPKHSKVTYYNKALHNDHYLDVATLCGNFNTTQNYSNYIQSLSKLDYTDNKSKLFEYDSETEKFVYGSFDQSFCMNLSNPVLGYKLFLRNIGTLSVMVKPFTVNNQTNRYIFASILSSESNDIIKLGLFINKNNRLSVIKDVPVNYIGDGYSPSSYSFVLNMNEWNYVSIKWDSEDLLIKLNDSEYLSVGYSNVNIINSITYLGSAVDNYDAIYPLNGFMQMFTYSDVLLSKNQTDEIYNEGLIDVKNIYDENDRLIKKQYLSKGNTITKDYTYENSSFLTNKIIKESFINLDNDTNNQSIEYTYDGFNNITIKQIKDENNDQVEKYVYTYDSVFRLKSETHYKENNVFDYKNVYSYDLNGNVISIDNVTENDTLIYKDTYYYSSDVPNRLEDVKRIQGNNVSILAGLVYSDSIYPDVYVNQANTFALQWEGDKLVRCGVYYYKYNENGQRVSALNSSGFGKRYYYEGERLICVNHTSSNTSKNVLYHYDENGSLIGFNYDNKEYFFDRDITGNINRIIDEIGTVYVTYIYNAYGKVESKVNSNLTSDYIQIANNLLTMNVMLFKGYCYDRETGLYYCKTRYYSPELCRWISPDSIWYLDPDSINGLNLYCYCYNNPIAYADPSGNFAISAGVLLLIGCIGAAVIGGAVQGGTAAYNNGGDFDDVIEGIGKGASNGLVIGGSISLAIGGFIIGGSTILGSIMATYGLTIFANMSEVAITQGKKSKYDGDGYWALMNDINNALFINSGNILIGKPTLMSIPFYGTRITSKIPTIFNVLLSYDIDRIFDNITFLTSAKTTLLSKASPLGLIVSYSLTLWQYYSLIKSIVTTPDFENSRWILY